MVVISLFPCNAYASSYYSYKHLGLDYKTKYSMYSEGKNGYKLIMIDSIDGNTIYYRKAAFKYESILGHRVFRPAGKRYKSKLKSSTKYYKGAPYSYVGSILHAYRYSYKSSKFKGLKILQKVGKWTLLDNTYKSHIYFAKINNGKIEKLIIPVIFAI